MESRVQSQGGIKFCVLLKYNYCNKKIYVSSRAGDNEFVFEMFMLFKAGRVKNY